jgi:hypothetical protein
MTPQGGWFMAQAANCGCQPGRALALIAGLLLASGVLIHNSPAQTPRAKPADKPSTTKDKEKEKEKEKPVGARINAITVPKEAANDVAEMVKVINSKLETGWKENKLTPSASCTDYEFIRRASLDIIGRIAKPNEIAQFMKDPAQYRRSMLIDRLLESQDYPRHWANVWTNWLLGRSGTFGRGTYHEQLALWLEDQFAENKKHHEIVQALITAKGKNTENAAVNFVLAHVGEMVPQNRRQEDGTFEMVPVTSRITRLFLGVQTQCTQCHDHPFDANLKQEHFWGINAFLRQVGRNGTPPAPNMRRMQGYPTLELTENTNVNKEGLVTFEKRNGVLKEIDARFPFTGGDPKRPAKEGNRREELARLIVESPNFPRATVNRLWAVFFSKGFCNPVDDFNEQNAISNPELLNDLADKFKHYNYDMKKLIRWICNSEAYNLSCVANPTNDKPEHEIYFSRQLLKALSPEQLFESLMVATQSSQGKDEQKELRGKWLDNLVSNFGDDEGNEVNFNGTVVQALMMMNGEDINKAIHQKDKGAIGAVMKILSPQLRINELYMFALNRPASRAEVQRVLEKFPLRPMFKDKSPEAPYQDLLWGLLNSNEFMLNH